MIQITKNDDFKDFKVGDLIVFNLKQSKDNPFPESKFGIITGKYGNEKIEITTKIREGSKSNEKEIRGTKTLQSIRYVTDFSFIMDNNNYDLDGLAVMDLFKLFEADREGDNG